MVCLPCLDHSHNTFQGKPTEGGNNEDGKTNEGDFIVDQQHDGRLGVDDDHDLLLVVVPLQLSSQAAIATLHP